MQMLEYSQNMQIGLLSHLCDVPSTQAHRCELNVSSQEKIQGNEKLQEHPRSCLQGRAVGAHTKDFC